MVHGQADGRSVKVTEAISGSGVATSPNCAPPCSWHPSDLGGQFEALQPILA
jgi:hypothetical protein